MRFVCLAYHRVTNEPSAARDPYAVTPAQLRAQMAWLARRGYVGVSLATALRPDGVQRQRPIALTFDDGYLDFYTTAWPVLREFGFNATVFVVTEYAGRIAGWDKAPAAAALMRWEHARALAVDGVEIGAHGATHRPLDSVSPREVRGELAAAYHDLSRRLERPPAGVAYPYGHCSEKVVAASRAAGFRWGCTARGGVNTPGQPRFRLRRTLVRNRSGWLCFAIQVWTGYAHWAEWRMDLRGVL